MQIRLHQENATMRPYQAMDAHHPSLFGGLDVKVGSFSYDYCQKDCVFCHAVPRHRQDSDLQITYRKWLFCQCKSALPVRS
jgi:hypothetical protein